MDVLAVPVPEEAPTIRKEHIRMKPVRATPVVKLDLKNSFQGLSEGDCCIELCTQDLEIETDLGQPELEDSETEDDKKIKKEFNIVERLFWCTIKMNV